MLVNRRTFIVKGDRRRELVDLMKAEQEGLDLPIVFRVYTPVFGPFNTVCAEWEWESLDQYNKFWADWYARPETAAFMKKWSALIELGGKNELWTLET